MNSMKKKCLLTGLLAAVMLFTSGIALADTCIVNASKLYLREKATSDSDALQSFRKGAELEILGKSGSWYKVTDGKVTGYVYAEYVSVVKSSDDSLQKGDQGNAVKQVKELTDLGFEHLPVCMAKTQYSFSDDPKKLGAPEGFRISVRNLKVSAGAGFIVALTGDVMTMPGLLKSPAAERIDVDSEGRITGLF